MLPDQVAAAAQAEMAKPFIQQRRDGRTFLANPRQHRRQRREETAK
jgi:hypothetical protein